MAQTSLAILCDNAAEALSASRALQTPNGVICFFIILGAKADTSEMAWVKEPDMCLVLPNAKSFCPSVKIVGERANILYSHGANLLHCWATALPESHEIAAAQSGCESDKMHFRGKKVWGYSREYVLLNGMEEPTKNTMPEKAPIDPRILMARALRGGIVPISTLVNAITEVSPIESFHIVRRVDGDDMRCDHIIKALSQAHSSRQSEKGKTIFSCGPIPPKEITELRKTVGRLDGCLVLAVPNDRVNLYTPLKPYRQFLCDNDCAVLIFSFHV